MKKLIAIACISAFCTSAHAEVGVLVGVTYAFGSNSGVGFTLQGTSTRKEDRGFAAAGVSYYPFSSTPSFGMPVGVGYQGNGGGVVVNYDLLLQSISVGGGYVNTKGEKNRPAPIPPPVPPPPPPPPPPPVPPPPPPPVPPPPSPPST